MEQASEETSALSPLLSEGREHVLQEGAILQPEQEMWDFPPHQDKRGAEEESLQKDDAKSNKGCG